MKDKEKKIAKRMQGHRFHAIKSDPTSPATARETSTQPPPPLDLTRVLSGRFENYFQLIAFYSAINSAVLKN